MIIEHIHEQGSGEINEDACVIGEDLFGVFDGATSLQKQSLGKGKTGGYLASNIAGEVFKNNNAPLKALAVKANSAIKHSMIKNGLDVTDRNGLWSTSAAVVRIKDNRYEWVQTGDSLVLAIYKDGTYRILTDYFDHDRETLEMWKKVSCESNTPIMEVLKEQILNVRSGMNITYGVFNGEERAMDFLKQGSGDIKDIKTILIFTDGLFMPSEKPDMKRDFHLLVKLYQSKGLSGVRDYIRSLEKTDPLCKMYPRFKPHDDIAAISLTFN